MAGKGLAENNYIVTTKEICAIFGLKARRIQQLAEENVIVRAAHGKYDLPASIKNWVEYHVEMNTAVEGKLDKYEEEAKWVFAKRQKTELEVKIMKGELHRSEDVEMVMSNMLGNFRAKLLSLPTKVAPLLLGKTDLVVIRDSLKDAVYEAMDELSDYDPNVFYENSKDKLMLEDDEELEEIEQESEVIGQKEKE